MTDKITVTVTPSRRDTTTLMQGDFTREELTRYFTTFKPGDKDGEAFIPAIFRPCPSVCRNHGQEGKIDCGGDQLHRLSANVSHMTGLALDFDGVRADTMAAILKHLQRKGLEFWWWNTFSHSPPDDCRFRVFVPFVEPMPIPSPHAWSNVAWGALVKHMGLEATASADQACKDPARVYYLPRFPASQGQAQRGASFVP
jgi:hypothetical protein